MFPKIAKKRSTLVQANELQPEFSITHNISVCEMTAYLVKIILNPVGKVLN
jgi:hypothetical protein